MPAHGIRAVELVPVAGSRLTRPGAGHRGSTDCGVS